MADRDLLDRIVALTEPSDASADLDAVAAKHERNLAAVRRFVAAVKREIPTDVPEGRRLRRALDQAVTDAERLVAANRAQKSSMTRIREAAEALRERTH